MKPLLILLGTFIISVGIFQLRFKNPHWHRAGRIAMAAMLFFTSVAHFAFLQGMSQMIPDFIPFKKEWVIITGILEIAAGIGLLFKKSRKFTSILLIIFLILILPANINSAMQNLNYETGNFDGNGICYLWFRIPMQIFYILWIWKFGYKPKD
ncbi:hypothetical protein IMZ16_03640 [Cruoricaptor ignavus]|uniref:DoxX protein n=1 Tax=Cruoricaptor ignavus TaxID=1118202 RepID=A0A7M1T5H4_9FLAO|nr:hypothetical protein [Cruoricaptor ignavus]QOR74537.1 hypothetical protein IMZ16_03640 [Cruoricaptor ignavus]